MDRYSYARKRVAVRVKEFSIGTVTLTRSTQGAPATATPYTPGPPTETVYTLDARVDGAINYLSDATIQATDLVVIASPKARDADGAVVEIVPRMSDVLRIDGAKKAVKKIDAVPAAGAAAVFHIFIAS